METWRPVPGYEGDYEVSSLGRVRSLLGKRPRILKATSNRRGYLSLRLCGPRGRRRAYVAHLVLEAFVGPRPPGMEAAHGDAIRSNNSLANLSWKTPLENAQDKFRTGTQPLGSRHHAAKLTEADVAAIRRDRRVQREIAQQYGVSQSLIQQLQSNKGWNHVC